MTSVQPEKVPKERPDTTALTSGFAGHTLQEPIDNWELRPVIKFSFIKTLISQKTPAIRADIHVRNFRLNICYIYTRKAKHRNIGLPHCKFIRFIHVCVCNVSYVHEGNMLVDSVA
jgi:hypothetical protein